MEKKTKKKSIFIGALLMVIVVLVALSMIPGKSILNSNRGGVSYQCSDGQDNDGDGYCDFAGCEIGKGKNKVVLDPDPDCESAEDDDESSGVCIPTDCSALGYNCGVWDDGCGGQLICGQNCSEGYICLSGQCVLPPSGDIYYVSTSGDDNNDGLTEQTPWKTLQYAESHATAPGSIIALKRGDNWASATALGIQHGGTPEEPITWDGDLWGPIGDTKAIISNTQDRGQNDPASIVTIANCDNVIFQNIVIDGNSNYAFGGLVIGGNPWQASGLYQNDESNIVVQGCEIREVGGRRDYSLCLLVQTWNNDMSNITIRNNNVHDCATWGISVYMGKASEGAVPSTYHDLYIGYNTVTNCQKARGDDGPNIGLSGGIMNAVVEHNTIPQGSYAPNSGLDTASDPESGFSPQGVVFQYNDVRMNDVPAFLAQNGGAQQVIVHDNYLYTGNPGNEATVRLFPADYTGARFHFYDNTISSDGGLCYADSSGQVILSANNTFIPASCGP